MNPEGLADRLRAIFVSELEDQLRTLNQGLLAQESDPANPGGLGALFRIVHTLKGAASAAHVEPIARVCHLLESRLARARDGKGDLEEADFTLLFRAADFLGDSAQRLRAGGAPDADEAAALQRWLAGEGAVAPVERVPAAPPAAAVEPEREREPAVGAEAPPEDSIVRVSARKLDALLASTGQLRTAARRFTGTNAELERLHDELEQLHGGLGRALMQVDSGGGESGPTAAAIAELQRLREQASRLSDSMGDLAARTRADERALERAAGEIGSSVHHVRLRPFSDACIPLPRAVRDLATATGREARVEISGGNVEADRAVIDVLSEVLLHLVRNAVDHGLETPAEREAMGKNRVGTIRVSASHDGPRLAVSVSDDGAGIDLAAVRARLATLGEPIPADPRELEAALFRPGFSTRRDVNPISGRGVGLDVVRTALQRIGGTAEMRWEEGKGTTFRISCPVSLSTLRVLLVAVDDQLFAIPTGHIEKVARIPASEIRRIGGRPSVLGAAGPVPLVTLAAVLGPPLRPAPASDPMMAVSLHVGGRRLAVGVDELVAEEEIMLRPLRLKGRAPAMIGGAAILAAGEVALVLDVPAVLEAGARVGADGIGLPVGPVEEVSRSRILVIDDSITTRTLEESILRAAGFDVETAADGESGWRILRERPFQLVVSDVEMPRMDGFELCRAIRGDQRLAATPVVLVSALESAEHRARGLEAGADAYLPKSSFDQRDLLDTIQQLLG